jgi:hypothetical protein
MEGSSGDSPPPPIFKNRYWILRHGRSVPNERGIIVSSLVQIRPIHPNSPSSISICSYIP